MKHSMRLWTGLALCSALSLAPVSAQDDPSEAISWSFFEGAFVHDNFNSNGALTTDGEGLFARLQEGTGNGFGARGSITLPWTIGNIGTHIVSDYSKTSHDPAFGFEGNAIAAGIVDLDQEEFRLAVGFHHAVSEKTHLFLELGVVNSRVEFGGFQVVDTDGNPLSGDLGSISASKASFDAKAGFRRRIAKFEVTAWTRFHGAGSIADGPADTLEFESRFKVGAGALYHLSKAFQIGADYAFSTPGKLRLFGRITF